MIENRPSDTAEGVCLFRAWEEGRPVERRILDDPYATSFLTSRGRAALKALRGLGPAADLGDRVLTGLAAYALARHACIDAWLVDALSQGEIAQVVLLGAGYDSRAWRLRGALGDRVLYELDHPATGGRKSEVVAQHAADWPASPRCAVTADLSREPFAPALLAAGWQPERPTFWIWEGVSMYLDPAAVRGTVDAVVDASAPGSRLAMDFWAVPPGWHPRAVLTRVAAATFAFLGEPVRGSFDVPAGTGLLTSAGLSVLDVAQAPELQQRFVPDGRPVLPDCWCVLAGRTA
ncbi:MAG: SAM-dependent methyltransferase [Alphaproteobacteria bacterium]|nr:SAM-dependent methyltransferase [Alphaproteobacteria bacterium]